MRSRLFVLLVVFVGLAVTGSALNRVIAPVWADGRARQPAWRLDSSVAAAGQGVTLALLGGFRALVADLGWLRMYALWEKQDLPATETLLNFVATVDPRPVYFWLNGARIIGYDFSAWRILALGGYEKLPADQQDRIVQEQARAGVRHLEVAMKHHSTSAELWIERAGLEANKLRDLAAGAESYRRASEMPHAPYYAARLHAELLRRLGRKEEALAWLKQLHRRLPAGDEAAAADVVLERIRDLEQEMRVPLPATYQPPR